MIDVEMVEEEHLAPVVISGSCIAQTERPPLERWRNHSMRTEGTYSACAEQANASQQGDESHCNVRQHRRRNTLRMRALEPLHDGVCW